MAMKHVTIVIPDGDINLSSITGTFEILTRADKYWQSLGNPPRLEVCLAGYVDQLELDMGFFTIHPRSLRTISRTDLIIIPSLLYNFERIISDNEALVPWIRDQYKAGAEIASICSGAFLLAATGLLEGKSCSTHWNAAASFRRMFPEIELHVDKLITVGPGIYTNGGAYSFLNLVLMLVEKYFDRDTAVVCSKIFQIDIDRSSQSPFAMFKAQMDHGDELVVKAQSYIEQNMREKISFEELASELAISRRNFDRRFIKATGNTPVEYLQRLKVEVAKRELEKGRKSIFEVMSNVGYSDDKAFREVFKRMTSLSPLEYKAKYNKEAAYA